MVLKKQSAPMSLRKARLRPCKLSVPARRLTRDSGSTLSRAFGLFVLAAALAPVVASAAAAAQNPSARSAWQSSDVGAARVDVPGIRTLVEQVEIWPGAQRLLIPVSVTGAAGGVGREGLSGNAAVGGALPAATVQLDGAVCPARLICLWVASDPQRAQRSRWARWWGPRGGDLWGAGTREPTHENALGASSQWFVWVDVGAAAKSRAPGSEVASLRIGGVPVRVRSLSAAALARGAELVEAATARPPAARAAIPVATAPAAADGSDASALLNALTPIAAIPSERWRISAALLPFNVGVPALPTDPEGDAWAAAAFDDLEEQSTQRWRGALGTLAATDGDIARRMAAHLLLTVRWEIGLVPMWSAADPRAAALCAAVLSADAPPRELARASREWLALSPPAAVWVMDDAASAPGADLAVRVGALNFTPVTQIASAAPAGAPVSVTADVPPRGGAQLVIPHPLLAAAARESGARKGAFETRVPLARQRDAALPGAVDIRSGALGITLDTFGAAISLRPPGIDIGPLAPDLTAADLLQSMETPVKASASAADWETRGRLYFLEDPRAPGGGAWMLYLESARGSDDVAGQDRIRIELGALGAGIGGLDVVAPPVSNEPVAGAQKPQPPPLPQTPGAFRTTARAPDDGHPASWSVWVTLPPRAVDAHGILRLALQRTDARGVHSAWPRAMLPWQIESGRIAFDTSTWLGLPAE
ncbi:hypothetical protein BH11PLA1_BH11PLA1_14720 [soil metagenome]